MLLKILAGCSLAFTTSGMRTNYDLLKKMDEKVASFGANDDSQGFVDFLASDQDYCRIDSIFDAVRKRAHERCDKWMDSAAEIMTTLEDDVNRTEKYVLKIVELFNIFGAVRRENPQSLHGTKNSHQLDDHFTDIQDWFAYMQTEFGEQALTAALNAYFGEGTLLIEFMLTLPAHVTTLPQKQAPTHTWEEILEMLMVAGANPRLRRRGDSQCNCGEATSHDIAVIELFRAHQEIHDISRNPMIAQWYHFSSVGEAFVYLQRNIQVFKRCADMFAHVLSAAPYLRQRGLDNHAIERVFHFVNFDMNQELKNVGLEKWWYRDSGYCPEFAVPVDIQKGQ